MAPVCAAPSLLLFHFFFCSSVCATNRKLVSHHCYISVSQTPTPPPTNHQNTSTMYVERRDWGMRHLPLHPAGQAGRGAGGGRVGRKSERGKRRKGERRTPAGRACSPFRLPPPPSAFAPRARVLMLKTPRSPCATHEPPIPFKDGVFACACRPLASSPRAKHEALGAGEGRSKRAARAASPLHCRLTRSRPCLSPPPPPHGGDGMDDRPRALCVGVVGEAGRLPQAGALEERECRPIGPPRCRPERPPFLSRLHRWARSGAVHSPRWTPRDVTGASMWVKMRLKGRVLVRVLSRRLPL